MTQREPATNVPSGHMVVPRPPGTKLPSGAICGPCRVSGTNCPFGVIWQRPPPPMKLPSGHITHGPRVTKLPSGHITCADATEAEKRATTDTANDKILNFMIASCGKCLTLFYPDSFAG